MRVADGDRHELLHAREDSLLPIWHTELLADRSNPRLDALVLTGRQIGEEVMLDLVVEKPVEEVANVSARREIDRADDLPQEPFASIAR